MSVKIEITDIISRTSTVEFALEKINNFLKLKLKLKSGSCSDLHFTHLSVIIIVQAKYIYVSDV